MAGTTMTRDEREAFLAGVHVGVFSVTEDGRGPLTVPVWYGYEPGGEVWFLTGGSTRKAAALRGAGRASLCAQSEAPPYAYVTVEGAVSIEEGFDPEQRRGLAERYLGAEFAELYISATAAEAADYVTVRLRPERWVSCDYGKVFQ